MALEIEGAFKNSIPNPANSDQWTGTSPNGVPIMGYYRKPAGTAATVGLYISLRSNMKAEMSVSWNPVLKRHGLGSAVIGAKEIAAWLSDDLSRGQDSINDWLEHFSAVATGETVGGYFGTGNAHHVRTVGEYVLIECEFVDDLKVFLTCEQVVEALKKYSAFLAAEVGVQTAPPPTFEVEFEADGDTALDRYLDAGGKLGT